VNCWRRNVAFTTAKNITREVDNISAEHVNCSIIRGESDEERAGIENAKGKKRNKMCRGGAGA
jgi:hypothetical protein